VRKRRRKNGLPDLASNLQKIHERISSQQKINLEGSEKSSRGLHNGKSKRRSRYIGVLRNGNRWQVLINVGKKKKYIGTYEKEKIAAIAHDFYSIGLNMLSAKTNFSYDESIIAEMIDSYLDSGHNFNPSAFAGRIN
jgi:hypothetical protein